MRKVALQPRRLSRRANRRICSVGGFGRWYVSISTTFLFSAEILLVPIGKTLSKDADVTSSIPRVRYYVGWADKVHGKTIEVGAGTLPLAS